MAASGGSNVIRVQVRVDRAGGANAIRDVQNDAQRAERQFRETSDAADRLGDVTQRAGREASEALERATRSATELSDAVDDDEGWNALRERAGGALDSLAEGAGQAGEVLAAMGPYGKAAAVTIGAAMAAATLSVKLFYEAIQASSERTQALARSAAYMTLSKEDAARFGKVAGQVYMDNWGESIEDAGNAVRGAMLYIMPTADKMKGAVTPSLTAVAERVQALADVTQEESTKIAFAIGQMLKTGVAKNVDEAFDLLHHALGSGIDGMEDLIDSMQEYNALMAQSGLSARQMFGMFKQGMDAGAYGIDKIVDAIKEFRLRVTGGGQAVEDAFKDLGVNAEDALEAISKGGPEAAAMLDKVLDSLRKLQGEDAAKAALAIQALFGGPGEDLGNSIFAIDPSAAVEAFGDIAGAADAAAARLGDAPMNAVEALRRKWEMMKADIGDKLMPVWDMLSRKVSEVAGVLQGPLSDAIKNVSQYWNEHREDIQKFADLLNEIVIPAIGGALLMAIWAAEGGMELLIDIAGMLGVAYEKATKIVLTTLGWLLSALHDVISAAASAARALGFDDLAGKLDAAARKIEDFQRRANNALGNIQNRIVTVDVVARIDPGVPDSVRNSLSMRASGGVASGWILAGEHGKELINVGGSAKVFNAAETDRMMSGGGAPGYGGGQPVVLTAAPGAGGVGTLVRLVLDLIRDKEITLTTASGEAVMVS